MFGYADGSVHWVSDKIDIAVYRGMSTKAGKELASLDP
jgi:hypothetical protein